MSIRSALACLFCSLFITFSASAAEAQGDETVGADKVAAANRPAMEDSGAGNTKTHAPRHRPLFGEEGEEPDSEDTGAEIVEQGLCKTSDCDIRNEFLTQVQSGAVQIGNVQVDRDLLYPGRREITISWDVGAPGAPTDLPPGQRPSSFHVLVIEETRYRVFNVTRKVADSAPVRSRGRGHNNKGGRNKPHPHRSTLRPAQTLTFNVIPDQAIEFHVRPVSTHGKPEKKSLPKGLGISYEPAPKKSSQSTYSSSLTRESSDEMPVGKVKFSDASLGKCVLSAVNGDEDYPVVRVTTLDCSGAGIEYLDGLEHFSGLDVLDLSSNDIGDLSPLSALVGLQQLDLSHNRWSYARAVDSLDISPLSPLNNLKSLHLDSSQIGNIAPLAQLASLETLTVSGNAIDYIPDFSATAIRSADFSSNPVTDISGLSYVDTLETVDLSDGRLGDLVPLIDNANLPETSLITVYLSGNPSLHCSQLDGLSSAGSVEDVIHRGGDCISLLPPSGLSSSSNPSVLNEFELSWEIQEAPSNAYHEIWISPEFSSADPEYYTSASPTLDLSELPERPVGSYIVQVRVCEPSSGQCSGWSLGVEQVVLGDGSLPFDEALGYVSDQNLWSCIAAHQTIEMDEAGALSELTCDSKDISSLTGIERFPGISKLNVSGNSVQALQPLGLLPALTNVSLSGNPFGGEEIGHLLNLRDSYTKLDLSQTAIDTVSALGNLQSIDVLDITSTTVSDLSPLSNVSIPNLRASRTAVEVVPPLTGTISLALDHAQVSDVSGLSSISDTLAELILTNNPIGNSPSNAEALSTLTNLNVAYLGSTQLTEISFVSGWSKLYRLRLDNNSLTSMDGLEHLSELRHLNLQNTGITSLSSVASLAKLRVINARGTSLTELTPLAGLERLLVVAVSGGDLSGNGVLSPLQGKQELEALSLSQTGVTDISPIVALAQDPGSALSSVKLTDEPNLTCAQVNAIWEAGALELVAGQEGTCVAGTIELRRVVLAPDEKTYEVRWDYPDVPPGYYRAGLTRIDYDFGAEQGSQYAESGFLSHVITQDRVDDTHFRFRAVACADQQSCTIATEWQYAVYPMMRPVSTTAEVQVEGGAALQWDYPEIPPANQPDTYFKVSSPFPVVDPVNVSWVSGEPWQYLISDPSQYPGRVATVGACRVIGDSEQCGPVSHAVFREPVDPPPDDEPQVQEPSNASLTHVSVEASKYRLSWQPAEGPNADYYRIEELAVRGGNFEPIGQFSTTKATSFDVERYVPRDNSELAFSVAACTLDSENGDYCSQAAISNPVSVDTSSINLRSVHNLCWTLLRPAGGGGRRATIRWTYPKSGWLGGDLDPPVRFASRITQGPAADDENTDVRTFYAKPEFNAATNTWYYESEPVWVGAGSELGVWPAAGDRKALAQGIMPLDRNGRVDPDLRCSEFEVYDTAEQLNRDASPGLLSPGHWVTTLPRDADGNAVPYPGVQTGWQFYWANEMAQPIEEDGVEYDLLAIWLTYENRADDDTPEWTPVWYYSKLTVKSEAGGSLYAEGPVILPEKAAPDPGVGWVRVNFTKSFDGSTTTTDSRIAWISLVMDGVTGTATKTAKQFAIRDALLDEDIFDPDWHDSPNPHDHFRGVWVNGNDEVADETNDEYGELLGGADYMLSEWIVGNLLSWAVLGFDDTDTSNPVWFISFKCANGNQSTGCDGSDYDQFQHQPKEEFHTVYPGHSPFWKPTSKQIDNGELPSNFVQAGYGTGVGRYYKGTSELNVPLDHREAKTCISLHGDFGNGEFEYPYSFGLGGPNCTSIAGASELMKKVGNNHHIDFSIDGDDDERVCKMSRSSDGSPPGCEISIEWSTDDDFGPTAGPSVVPMVTMEGLAEPIGLSELCPDVVTPPLSYAGEGLRCKAQQAGSYRLRLVSRPDYESGNWDPDQSAVIATSKLLHVSGVSEPDPEVAPVGPDDPPAADPNFRCQDQVADCDSDLLSEEILDTSNVGATRGQFRVTESGAAEYTIPIMTAKGVAGVEPEIAVQYNSQQQDDGPLGRGWHISGLSAITRCGQTPARDDGLSTGVTLTSEDRFCLDGQRLMLVDGDYGSPESIYRLEVDNLTRVKGFERSEADGLIGYFEVRRPDGSISTYGFNPANGPDESAKVLAPEQEVPFAWPISRFSDSVGNYLQYEYSQPSQASSSSEEWIEWLPLRVRFTGLDNGLMTKDPFATIQFRYEYSSPEVRPARYIQGNVLRSTRLLEKVVSKSDNKILREYEFDYDPDSHAGANVLRAIEECYAINDGTPIGDGGLNCLPATQFSWLQSEGHAALVDGEHPPFGPPQINNFKGARAADIDGDGREEVVYARAGANQRAHFGTVENETPQSEYALDFLGQTEFSSECQIEFGRIGGWALSDLNSDGRAGLVYLVKHCTDSEPGIYYHGWDEQEEALKSKGVMLRSLPQGFDATNARLNIVDANGDGRMDIVVTIVDRVSTLESDILFYLNESTTDQVALAQAESVVYSYASIFEEIASAGCEYHYGFEVYDSGVAALDQSGKAALLVRATRRTACNDQLSNLDQYRDGSGNFTISRDTYLDAVTEGGSRSGPTLESFAHAWELDGIAAGGYRLVPKLEIEQISDAVGEDFFVSPVDYNADGYTDFLLAEKANSGDSTRFQLLLNQGEAALYDESTEVPKVEPHFSFSKDTKYKYAPLTLVIDSDGNGYPEILFSEKIPGNRLREYRRYPWPWATKVGDGPEATLLPSKSLGHDYMAHNCSSQQILPADIFGNGRVAIIGFVDPGDGDGGCADFTIREELESVASFPGQGLSRPDSRYLPDLVIEEFTDGFGAKTEVEYSSTGDAEVYLRSVDGLDGSEFDASDVVVPFGASFAVVKSVSSTSDEYTQSGDPLGGPEPSVARVKYAYAGAKIQAEGRGFLGFAHVFSFDERSGVLTTSRYRQDFPFIGRPRGSMRWKVADSPWSSPGEEPIFPDWDRFACEQDASPDTQYPVLLGCSFTKWSSVMSALDGPLVFSEFEREYHWAANTEPGGAIIGSQFTSLDKVSRTVDPYGNVETSVSEMFSEAQESPSALVYRQSATNVYFEVDAEWHLGRLKCSDVHTARRDGRTPDDPGLSEATIRTTRYQYDPDTGLLISEVIDTNTCEDDTAPYKTTTYSHDDFGNVDTTVVEGSDGTTRYSLAVYESDGEGPRGRYLLRSEVSLGGSNGPWRKVETIEERDRFGNPLRVIDARGQTTVNHFDLLGRPYYTYSSTGGWQKSVNAVCASGSDSDVACSIGSQAVMCPAGSRFARIENDAGGGRAYTCKDILGREVRRATRVLFETSVNGFKWSYQDQRYDYASRAVWATEPYLAGEPVYWTETDYDESGRVISISHAGADGDEEAPNVSELVERRQYEGLLTRHIADGVDYQVRTELRNPMGEVVEKTVAIGTAQEATTQYFYSALGELREVDAPVQAEVGGPTTATVILSYDPLGNRVRLSDPDKGEWVYGFNSQGDLVCQFDQEGRGVVNAYDRLGRLRERLDVSGSMPPQEPEDCLVWVQSDGSVVLPGQYTIQSETVWQYGDDQHSGGSEPFGEVIVEETSYFGASEEAVVRKKYSYDHQARNRAVVTEICYSGCQNESNFESFEERVTYDEFGRVFQQFDASSSFEDDSPYDTTSGSNIGGWGQQFIYKEGHLSAIKEARSESSGAIYWRVEEMDARGNPTRAFYGNGMELKDFYDPETGELLARIEEHATQHGYAVGQFQSLQWDNLGRLQSRTDLSLPATEQHEWFEYDERNRLESVHISSTGSGNPVSHASSWDESLRMQYDLSGNIKYKSDVQGGYSYGSRPHAVTSAGGRAFEYDSAGNLAEDFVPVDGSNERADQRAYSYHAFQKVRSISRVDQGSGSARVSEFYYGPDRSRSVHIESLGGLVDKTTFYIGNVEVHTGEVGRTEFRRSIAGKVLVTVHEATEFSRARYLHRDHLGSIVAMSDETGYVIARMSFDAWGQRRSPEFVLDSPTWVQWVDGTPPSWLTEFGQMTQHTPRGFTGHEHLDELGIIHMNGRIYDPHLARFLQADPFVEDSATINRYTYSHNSPLVYYDPSGYFSFKDFARAAISVAISVYTGGAAASGQWALFGAGAETLNAVSTVMIGGALSGAVASGSWDGALWGAFSGAAFYGVGQWVSSASWAPGDFAGSGLSGAQFAVKSIGHGLAGGIVSDLRGGKFGHGFASSFVSATSHPYIANGLRGNTFAQGTVSAIVGGTASRLSGGKFANGAVTAAMGYAFNQMNTRDGRGRTGRRGRGEVSAEGLPSTTCSDNSCVGYAWVSGEMQTGGDPRPFWLGTGMISEHQWSSVIPPLLNRNLLVEGLTLIADLQVGYEPGRWGYPHVRYEEVRQWQINLRTGEFTSRRYHRFERQFEPGLTYKPIEADQTRLYRPRLRSCIGGDCRVWRN